MSPAAATEARGQVGLRSFLAWVLIVLGVVYLTVAGGGALGIYLLYFRIASVAIVVAALVVWLTIGLHDPFWRPRSALTPAILACLAALAIADVGSDRPRIGYDFVAYAVLLSGAYLLLQRLFAHPFFGPRLGMLGVLLCIGMSVIYVGAVVSSWVQLWSQLGRIVTPPLRPFAVDLVYGSPNPIATVVILLWVAAIGHLGLSTTRARWVASSVTVVAATAVFLTGSRGAWVAAGLAGLVTGTLWLIPADRRRAAATLLRSRAVRVVGLGALAVLAIVVAVLFPAIAARLGEPASDTRFVFAAASFEMFLSHPLSGVGPGMWVVDRLGFTDHAAANLYVPHAHNLVLQSLAELGLVGVLAGLVVVAFIGKLMVQGARSPDSLARRLAWSALFGSVYFVASQMTDFYANLPAIGFCYVLTIARLDSRVALDRPAIGTAWPRTAVAFAAVLAFALATFWLARSEEAAFRGDQAVAAANADDWPAARTSAALAVSHDGGLPPYLFTLGLAEAHGGELAAAAGHIRQAAEIDDYPTAWLDVARLELDLGNEPDAREAVQKAMRLGYQEPTVAVGASTIDLELGDRAEAVAALASALLFAPGLASDPYWADPAWNPIFEDALSGAIRDAPPGVSYKLALEGEHPERVPGIIDALPADQRLVPELVARAWVGDRAAFDQLHALALSDPLDGETSSLCRRIAERSREPGWPGGTTWTCDGTGDPSAIIVVRVNPPRSWWTLLPGTNAFQHFPFVYRRFVPSDDLVPGLPHLGGVLT